MIDPALFDRARARIAASGFTPAIQTRIALMLSGAKSANLAFHGVLQWLPDLGVALPFIISQAARELEALTLLGRTTRWAAEPRLSQTAQEILAPLQMAWAEVMLPPGPLLNRRALYRGISLGHAQLARMRLLPVLPGDVDALDPFVVTLQRIEQENGRMLQTQIRLLKSIDCDLPLAEREEFVERDQVLVDAVFAKFLAGLGD